VLDVSSSDCSSSVDTQPTSPAEKVESTENCTPLKALISAEAIAEDSYYYTIHNAKAPVAKKQSMSSSAINLCVTLLLCGVPFSAFSALFKNLP